jgi:hypothetical protein
VFFAAKNLHFIRVYQLAAPKPGEGGCISAVEILGVLLESKESTLFIDHDGNTQLNAGQFSMILNL